MVHKRYRQHTDDEKNIILKRLTIYLGKDQKDIQLVLEQIDPLTAIKKGKVIIPKVTMRMIREKLIELG